MIDGLFITLVVSNIVVFLIACMRYNEDGDLAIWGLNFILSVILLGNSIYVQVPWIAATNSTTYTTGSQQFMEWPIFALALFMLFIDVVVFILQLATWRKSKNEIALP